MSHGRDAARDVRYGRRGGGWAPAPARAAAAGGVNTDKVDRTCPVCRRRYRADPKHETLHCGAKDCEAMATWTAEQWEGRARMARARAAANRGVVVDLIDREALRRYP